MSHATLHFSALLSEMARPELYRNSIFRLAETSVEAREPDLRRRRERVAFGADSKQPILPGLCPALPVNIDAQTKLQLIDKALQSLSRSPESRLIEEFFWFWPLQFGASQDDKAFAALSRNNLDQAKEIWHQQESLANHSGVASHNLAILNHAQALDLELSEAHKDADRRNQYWLEAFRCWKQVIENDLFWASVDKRARNLGDARLPTTWVEQFRAALPDALLIINAQLARQAAERSDGIGIHRQLSLMRTLAFPPSVMERNLKWVCEPVREQIGKWVQAAKEECDQEKARGKQAGQRLIGVAKIPLYVIDCLLPQGDSVRASLHDDVARQVLDCAIACWNSTNDHSEEVVTLFSSTADIAMGPAIRRRIQESLRVVRKTKISDQLAALRQSAQEKTTTNNTLGKDAAKSLIQAVSPLLAQLDEMLPVTDQSRIAEHDGVVTTILDCVIAHWNGTNLFSQESIVLLETASTLVMGQAVRTRLDQSLRTMRTVVNVEKVYVQLTTLQGYALERLNANKARGKEAAISLIRAATPLLTELDQLLPADNQNRMAAHDRVANIILDCLVNYSNETKDHSQDIVALYQQAEAIAVGDATRKRAHDNYTIINQNRLDAQQAAQRAPMQRVFERLATLLQNAHAQVEQNNGLGREVAQDLIQNSPQLLNELDRLLQGNDQERISAHDAVANTILNSIINYCNHTHDYSGGTLAIYARSCEIAAGAQTSARTREAFETARLIANQIEISAQAAATYSEEPKKSTGLGCLVYLGVALFIGWLLYSSGNLDPILQNILQNIRMLFNR